MIHLNPIEDGVTHINIYSKGQTALGRLLSNFAHTPFTIPEGTFQSVEGYWYWILTKDERLKDKVGYAAKKLGKSLLKVEDQVTEDQLRIAYKAKLEQTSGLREMLENNKLPLVHYYVQNGRVLYTSKFFWTAILWTKL